MKAYMFVSTCWFLLSYAYINTLSASYVWYIWGFSWDIWWFVDGQGRISLIDCPCQVIDIVAQILVLFTGFFVRVIRDMINSIIICSPLFFLHTLFIIWGKSSGSIVLPILKNKSKCIKINWHNIMIKSAKIAPF